MKHAFDDAHSLSAADPSALIAEAVLRHRLEKAVAGEFTVGRLLGRGGMGAVFEAHDPALDRAVAIKVMLPQLGSAESIERFRREARTVARLDHPNIVPVYAVRDAAGLVFLIMRYIDGITLEARIRASGPLSIRTAQSMLTQVGAALAYAHRQGVVHRDVKPSNVMIGPGDWAVVTDFGLAKSHNLPELTATGTTVGTPSYMSPEQCSDAPITAASDQYSLGVMAYEMLTGTTPFQATTLAALVKKHMFDEPPSLDRVLPGCPPVLCEAVTRMLQKQPEDRWPSVDEAVAHIGAIPAPADEDVGRTRPLQVVDAEAPTERFSTPSSPIARPAPRPRARGSSIARIAALVAVALLPGRSPDGVRAAETARAPVPVADTVFAAAPAATGDGRPATGDERPRTDDGRQTTVDRRPAERQPAAPARPGHIWLGTRQLQAVLYVNDRLEGVIDRLRLWTVPTGTVRLSIRVNGCTWDSTVTVRTDTLRIGHRAQECAP